MGLDGDEDEPGEGGWEDLGDPAHVPHSWAPGTWADTRIPALTAPVEVVMVWDDVEDADDDSHGLDPEGVLSDRARSR